ncbi:hypothetical protein EMIT0P201_50254 [Pseudomonas chlororaphis]
MGWESSYEPKQMLSDASDQCI